VSPQERVTQEVRELEALDLHALREVWRGRWGAPPRLRSPELLRFMIAWRLQVAVFGDLDAETRRMLRRPPSKPKARFQAGTRISRDWQGERYQVEAVEGGYRYDGTVYKSLSQVARQITGARWNGPRFFGLRDKAAA
jgi:hypothetical protein